MALTCPATRREVDGTGRLASRLAIAQAGSILAPPAPVRPLPLEGMSVGTSRGSFSWPSAYRCSGARSPRDHAAAHPGREPLRGAASARTSPVVVNRLSSRVARVHMYERRICGRGPDVLATLGALSTVEAEGVWPMLHVNYP